MGAMLECARCGRLFSEELVYAFEFFPDNHLCFDCCESLKQLKHSKCCFGKLTQGKMLGYDPKALPCKQLCPDRNVCKLFVGGTVYEYRELTEEARKQALKFLMKSVKVRKRAPTKEVFRSDTNIGKLYNLCKAGCTLEEFEALCKQLGASRSWALRILRREEVNGHEWTLKEKDGRLKLDYPRKS